MNTLVFRALWGMTGAIPEQIAQIAAAGYDGVEVWPDAFALSPGEWLALLHRYGLKLIVAAGGASKSC